VARRGVFEGGRPAQPTRKPEATDITIPTARLDEALQILRELVAKQVEQPRGDAKWLPASK